MKKRFTEAQVVGFLREADCGIPVKHPSTTSAIVHILVEHILALNYLHR